MKETTHTPGPWKIDDATDSPLAVIRDDEMGEGICEISERQHKADATPEQHANARLIERGGAR